MIYIMSKLESCSALSPFGEEDKGGVPTIINDIKHFQHEEIVLLNKLQGVANSDNPNQELIKEYTKALVPFQQSRIKLMKHLNNISTKSQCSLANDRKALQDQITLLAIIENQLQSIEKETNALLQERTGRKRMVEITNYEYLRYNSHKNILKTISFCSLFVLAGIYLNRMGGPFLSWLGYPVIVIAIAVAAYLTVKKMWWNYHRNPMNWNKFIWDEPRNNSNSNNNAVWGNTLKIFEKDIEDDAHNLENKVSDELSALTHKVEDGIDKTYKDISSSPKANIKETFSESFAPYN